MRALKILAVGMLGCLASCSIQLGGSDSADRVGAFSYESDVVPLVDRVMRDGLGKNSAATFMALMAPGTATEQEMTDALAQVADAAGEWSGSYTFDRHVRSPDTVFPELGPIAIEVMEVYVDAAFSAGPARVRIAVGDVDRTLRVIAWDVTPANS